MTTPLLDDLDGLDGIWNPEKGRPVGYQAPRLWVVLARDIKNTWRVREVRAYSPDHAAQKYNNIFDYEVVGVGLLGGSGHPVQWLRNGEWNK